MTKIIAITGASSGIGAALAVLSAKSGHTVYASMRNLDKRETLDALASDAGVSLHVQQMDVQDTASVDTAVAEIVEREGRIDVMVANAGVGFVRSTEQATEEDVKWVLDTNFHGVVRCTKAVLPHMRAAGKGHVIATSSVGGLVGQPFNEIYCASKFAVEGYIESLASYVGPAFGVNFTSVEPGGIKSEFVANVMAHIAKSGGMMDDAYAPIMQKYLGGREGRDDTGVYQTSEEVAKIMLDCIESDTPPIRLRTSEWSENFCRFKTQADRDGGKQQAMVVESMLGGLD